MPHSHTSTKPTDHSHAYAGPLDWGLILTGLTLLGLGIASFSTFLLPLPPRPWVGR